MEHYPFTEALLIHITYLRWSEDTAALVLDRAALAAACKHYEAICLMLFLVSRHLRAGSPALYRHCNRQAESRPLGIPGVDTGGAKRPG
ncbi:hypothetical protein [Halomonas sp. QHL1]|uniref:hypothetical protein n=1 Tax=Halomonas sp. QHL1 TaxID=1123773 RepID=UPI0008FD2E2C|nr:hypothetical protein [Halomonas sp. QHL1]OJA06616.1 hypothetical protein QHL1GM_15125 [Halomonas sp. QHL1]